MTQQLICLSSIPQVLYDVKQLNSARSEKARPAVFRIMLILAVAVAAALAWVFLAQPYLTTQSHADAGALPRTEGATPFFYPGINEPPTVPAAQATLADDEEVIGVSVDGRSRAYCTSAFLGPQRHVVNDMLFDRPITVPFWDR